MSNGLGAGDSIKPSDTFSFYRGERDPLSAGRRDVPFSDLVTFLEAEGLGGGSAGATADELERLTTAEQNLGVNTLRDAVAEGRSIHDMVGGFADVYEDQTGVDLGASTGEFYLFDSETVPAGFSASDVTSSTTTNTYLTKLSDLGLTGSVTISEIRWIVGSAGVSSGTVNYLIATPNGSNVDIEHVGAVVENGSDGDLITFDFEGSPRILDADTDYVGISSSLGTNWHKFETGGAIGTLYSSTTAFITDATNETLTSASNTASVHVSAGTSSGYYTNAPSSVSVHTVLLQSESSNGNQTDFSAGTQGANLDSTGNHTVTALGIAGNSTGITAKFGSTSFFVGSPASARISVSASSDLDILPTGAEDFTVDFWINPVNFSGTDYIMGHNGDSAGQWAWNVYHEGTTSRLAFGGSTDGTTSHTPIFSNAGVLSAGTWTHCAFVYTGGVGQWYVNGSISGSSGAFTGGFQVQPTQPLILGDFSPNQNVNMVCYLEEVSVLKGGVRIPPAGGPTAPYTLSIPDMTLISQPQTADSAPTNAFLVIKHEALETLTIGTDFTAEISMDGGSTYSTPFTMTKHGEFSSDIDIITTEDLTLDSTSGTSIVLRLSAINEKAQNLHGVYVQWR